MTSSVLLPMIHVLIVIFRCHLHNFGDGIFGTCAAEMFVFMLKEICIVTLLLNTLLLLLLLHYCIEDLPWCP